MTLPLSWRIASALSQTPFRMRREAYHRIGDFLAVDPNIVSDALDARLDAWHPQGGAQ